MKIYNYVLLGATLMFVLYIMGFQFTASSWVFTKMGLNNISNIQSSNFFVALALLFAIGVGGALIGTFFNISPTFAIKGAYLMTLLGGLVADYISILTQPNILVWVRVILSFIFIPLIAGFLIALEEFWEGRD